MVVRHFGHNLEVDLHGMRVADAKRELAALLTRCDKETHEIEVIHGCHGGTALQTMVRREFSHPRLVKRILSMNNGSTTLVIKP